MKDVVFVHENAYSFGAAAVKKDGTLWSWGTINLYSPISANKESLVPIKYMDGVKLPASASAITTELGNKISWTPETSNTGYWIYRSTEKGKDGERINETPIKGGIYVDVNVDSNTTYYYTIIKDGDTADKAAFAVIELKTGEILGVDAEGIKNYILMQIGKDTMSVNGEVLEIDPGRGTTPVIINSRTMGPIAAIIKVLDGTVAWDGSERKVSVSASGHNIALWIDRTDIVVDGASAEMDVAPQIVNDRTLLPLKFVAENLECLIALIGSSSEIIVLYYT